MKVSKPHTFFCKELEYEHNRGLIWSRFFFNRVTCVSLHTAAYLTRVILVTWLHPKAHYSQYVKTV